MAKFGDTIILSSDEESPPKKKLNPFFLGNMTGITITPIEKTSKRKKKLPDICIISDEDESSEEESSGESVDIKLDRCQNSKSSQNKEKHGKNGIKKSKNEDCEIISDGEATKIIDITEVNDNPKKSDVIELEDRNVEKNETTDLCEITENGENKIGYDNLIENKKEISIQNVVETLNVPKNDKNISTKEDSLLPEVIGGNIMQSIQCNQSPEKISVNDLIEDFLEICKKNIENTEYNLSNQFDILKQYYKKCEPTLIESDDFRKMIENNIKKAKVSPSQSVISFGEVFVHLKDLNKVNTVQVTKKKKLKLKKLEHTIKLLVKKIKELENADVDFSDEEDSSYIKLNRFISRLNKLYLKYCAYLKSNPYSGRITYSKLNFVDSKYNEFNRAISKQFKDNKKFPSYIEMENFIRKIAEENKMELSDADIKCESQHCFKKLGDLLQIRRKRELYEVHSLYIQDSGSDPANNDANLKNILELNFTTAQKEIDQLCHEYVKRQDHGEEPEDSDNNTESSDNESGKAP